MDQEDLRAYNRMKAKESRERKKERGLQLFSAYVTPQEKLALNNLLTDMRMSKLLTDTRKGNF
jgi:hypothetical protein